MEFTFKTHIYIKNLGQLPTYYLSTQLILGITDNCHLCGQVPPIIYYDEHVVLRNLFFYIQVRLVLKKNLF